MAKINIPNGIILNRVLCLASSATAEVELDRDNPSLFIARGNSITRGRVAKVFMSEPGIPILATAFGNVFQAPEERRTQRDMGSMVTPGRRESLTGVDVLVGVQIAEIAGKVKVLLENTNRQDPVVITVGGIVRPADLDENNRIKRIELDANGEEHQRGATLVEIIESRSISLELSTPYPKDSTDEEEVDDDATGLVGVSYKKQITNTPFARVRFKDGQIFFENENREHLPHKGLDVGNCLYIGRNYQPQGFFGSVEGKISSKHMRLEFIKAETTIAIVDCRTLLARNRTLVNVVD